MSGGRRWRRKRIRKSNTTGVSGQDSYEVYGNRSRTMKGVEERFIGPSSGLVGLSREGKKKWIGNNHSEVMAYPLPQSCRQWHFSYPPEFGNDEHGRGGERQLSGAVLALRDLVLLFNSLISSNQCSCALLALVNSDL
jgi:hypothetical protein